MLTEPSISNPVKNWKILKDWFLTKLFYEIFIPRKIFNKNSQIVNPFDYASFILKNEERLYE